MTSELINQMTDSYKKCKGHLAIGAQIFARSGLCFFLSLMLEVQDETVSSNQNQIEALRTTPKLILTVEVPPYLGLKNTKVNPNKNILSIPFDKLSIRFKTMSDYNLTF